MRTAIHKYGRLVLLAGLLLAISTPLLVKAGLVDLGQEFIDLLLFGLAIYFQGLAMLCVLLASWVMETTIYLTITHANLIINAEALNYGWTLLRDFGNLIFIGSLIYSAIKLILGLADTKLKQLIINIFVAGVLVNFSMFFCQIVIDASNYASTAILNQIVKNVSAETGTTVAQTAINKAVSSAIGIGYLNRFSIAKMFSNRSVSELTRNGGKIDEPTLNGQMESSNLNPFAVFASLMLGNAAMLIVAVSFAAISLMLLGRTVTLIYVIIISPVAILGYAVPYLREKVSNKWMDDLIKNNIFPPVFFILTLFTLRFLAFIQTIPAVSGEGSFLMNILQPMFMIAIGVMCIAYSLYYAASFGTLGSGMAKAIVSGTVSRLAAGSTGYIAKKIDDRVGKTEFGNSVLGRRLRNSLLDPVMTAKFGGTGNYKDYKKEQKESEAALKNLEEQNRTRSYISTINSDKSSAEQKEEATNALRNTLSGKSANEIAEIFGELGESANSVIGLISEGQMKKLAELAESGKNEKFSMGDYRKIKDKRNKLISDMLSDSMDSAKRSAFFAEWTTEDFSRLPIDQITNKNAIGQMDRDTAIKILGKLRGVDYGKFTSIVNADTDHPAHGYVSELLKKGPAAAISAPTNTAPAPAKPGERVIDGVTLPPGVQTKEEATAEQSRRNAIKEQVEKKQAEQAAIAAFMKNTPPPPPPPTS